MMLPVEILILFVVLFSASTTIARDVTTKYVLFDTDMGSDDAWALHMLLTGEKRLNNIKVLAITATNGNTDVDNAIKNAYRILDGVNRTDIPIYKGAAEAIIPIDTINDNFFGKNGFSDIEFWRPNYPKNIESIVQQKNAIEIIRDLIMQNPNKISLICLAPLTNIALAIKAYPEIKDKIKEVFIMGGNYKGRGNILPAAEFNFYKDPEAAHIVLNSLKCPMTIVPLESDESIPVSLDWRFNVLAKADQNNVQLLNEVEKIAFRNKTLYLPYDAFVAASFLFPDKMIQEMRPYNATVELQGFNTRGQMIVNHNSHIHNMNIIEKLNEKNFKKIMIWAANYD